MYYFPKLISFLTNIMQTTTKKNLPEKGGGVKKESSSWPAEALAEIGYSFLNQSVNAVAVSWNVADSCHTPAVGTEWAMTHDCRLLVGPRYLESLQCIYIYIYQEKNQRFTEKTKRNQNSSISQCHFSLLQPQPVLRALAPAPPPFSRLRLRPPLQA